MEKKLYYYRAKPRVYLPSGYSSRILGIDILRGICVVLMIADHFAVLFYNLAGDGFFDIKQFAYEFITSDVRQGLRFIVISVFFALSGICCKYSNNNFARSAKLMCFAVLLSIATYLLTIYEIYRCFIICGVIHCYAIFVFIYTLIEKSVNKLSDFGRKIFWLDISLLFAVIAVLFSYFKPTMESGNFLIYLGVPQTGYVPQWEYASPSKLFWAFALGVAIGQFLPYTYSKRSCAFPLLTFCGKYAGYIYALHVPIIALLILAATK